MRLHNPWASLRGLPHDVWALCAATLVNRIGTMALVFLVLYLTERGWSARDAGLVVSVFGVGSLIASALGGRLSDRIGARHVVLGSLALSGVFLLAYPLFHDRAAVFVMTLLWALTGEAFRPASFTLVSHATPPAQQRAAFAAVRLAINVGASIGPAVGGFLARVSMPAIFFVDGATSLAAAAFLWLSGSRRRTNAGAAATATEPHEEPAKAVAGTQRRIRLGVLADSRFALLCVAMLLLSTVFFVEVAALPLDLVRGQGMSEATLGILYALNAVLVVLFEVPLSARMSRWPAPRSLVLGAFCIAVGIGATAWARDFWTAVPTVVIWTLGEMLVFPAASTYVSEITSAARRGEGMGLYSAAFGGGFVLAPLLGTWAIDRWSADWMWFGAFVVGCIAACLFLRLDVRARQVA